MVHRVPNSHRSIHLFLPLLFFFLSLSSSKPQQLQHQGGQCKFFPHHLHAKIREQTIAGSINLSIDRSIDRLQATRWNTCNITIPIVGSHPLLAIILFLLWRWRHVAISRYMLGSTVCGTKMMCVSFLFPHFDQLSLAVRGREPHTTGSFTERSYSS